MGSVSLVETPLSVRVPVELRDRYARLSERTERPVSVYVRQALGEAIDRFEFEQRVLDASSRWRAGELKTYSLEEMDEILELED